jgi:hypothetical protein
MKKLLVTLFVVFIASGSFAQVSIMPKAGVSLAKISLTDDMLDGDPAPKSRIGIVLGAAFEFQLSDQFAIQPELLFHQKGWKEEDSGVDFKYTSNNTLNYIELPVMVKVKFDNFYISGGPYLGLGIGGKYKDEYSEGNFSATFEGKIKFGDEPSNYDGDDYYIENAMDFGLQIGAGMKLGPVIIDLRYGFGLSNLEDKPSGYQGDWKLKNSSLQFTVGYPLSK